MLRRKRTEELEQRALIEWARYFPDIFDYLFHIPNGGYRHKAEAHRLKLSGVKAGVPDLFYALPVSPYAGLFIELKAPLGTVSKPQKEFIQRARNVGYRVEVAWGWEQARDVILDYRRPLLAPKANTTAGLEFP